VLVINQAQPIDSNRPSFLGVLSSLVLFAFLLGVSSGCR
jgi:hypothetical protein